MGIWNKHWNENEIGGKTAYSDMSTFKKKKKNIDLAKVVLKCQIVGIWVFGAKHELWCYPVIVTYSTFPDTGSIDIIKIQKTNC